MSRDYFTDELSSGLTREHLLDVITMMLQMLHEGRVGDAQSLAQSVLEKALKQ